MRGFLVLSLLAQTLLYSQSQTTVDGVWNGGGEDIYTKGNQHYCLFPDAGSEATFDLKNNDRRFRSCVYVALGEQLGGKCKNDPSITVKDLGSHMYKIIVAPEQSANGAEYSLTANFDGKFGRCPDYYQANFLGMKIEDVNFLLGIIGVISALTLISAVVYTILTIGNF